MFPIANLAPVLDAFNLSGEPLPLAGGTTTTFRVGDAVLKRISPTSLENDHSPELAVWIAEFSAWLPQDGFRLAPPLRTVDGAYITPDGWTATAYLDGQHAQAEDIPACIQAVDALHRAIAGLPKHPYLDGNNTPWGYAHRGCLGERPALPGPTQWPAERADLVRLLDGLYDRRRPIPNDPWQVIHGDLNLANFLVAPGLPPAILDFSPYWGPPGLAMGTFANFSGPRRRNLAVLRHFKQLPHFDQFLLRGAIRMLLVVLALDGFEGWQAAEEKWAAEQVLKLT